MKSKTLVLPLVLLSLSLLSTPVQAQPQPPDIQIFVQPDERDMAIIVNRQFIEVSIMDYIMKSRTQTRLIGKPSDDPNIVWVTEKVSSMQRILDQDGKLLALVHTSIQYSGTVQIGDPPYLTGVFVFNYQYIYLDEVLILPPDLDKGHYTIWFENGIVVDYKGHGMMVPPWIP